MSRSTVTILLLLAAFVIAVSGAFIRQEIQQPPPDNRAAGDFTITLIGRLVDADTGAEISVAAVRVRTPNKMFDLGGPSFHAQIPANRVSTLTVVAPGYNTLEQEITPHYKRDATFNMDIPLKPVDLDQYRLILDDLKAVFDEEAYGLYPRLIAKSTRIVIEGGVAVMRYPRRERRVEIWPEWEGFEVAYGVLAYLEGQYPDQANQVLLNDVEVPSNISDQLHPTQRLVIPWVLFKSGGVVALDLTPLGTDINPLHFPKRIYGQDNNQEIERQFEAHREGIALDRGLPMKIVAHQGKTYYLQAAVNVLPDEYQFLLEGFEIQPATRTTPLVFVRGAIRGLRIKASAFDEVKTMMQADSPHVLQQKQHLLSREGDEDEDLDHVLNNNLDILYYLATKFENVPQKPTL